MSKRSDAWGGLQALIICRYFLFVVFTHQRDVDIKNVEQDVGSDKDATR